jgi:hypothetical protein
MSEIPDWLQELVELGMPREIPYAQAKKYGWLEVVVGPLIPGDSIHWEGLVSGPAIKITPDRIWCEGDSAIKLGKTVEYYAKSGMRTFRHAESPYWHGDYYYKPTAPKPRRLPCNPYYSEPLPLP